MRSFGIQATGDKSLVESIARQAERAGYRRLWINDTPLADGLETARWALESAENLGVGVGVIAIDRRPVPTLLAPVGSLGEHFDRLVLGIGAGFSPSPLGVVRSSIRALREEFPADLRLALAAMGPKMCRLAGAISDVVLLNWMTPERAAWSGDLVRESGGAAVAAYVRVALGTDAHQRLATEAALYRQISHYGRHFQAMGAESPGVAVVTEVGDALDVYEEVLDEVVVRALPGPNIPESIMEILYSASPP